MYESGGGLFELKVQVRFSDHLSVRRLSVRRLFYMFDFFYFRTIGPVSNKTQKFCIILYCFPN